MKKIWSLAFVVVWLAASFAVGQQPQSFQITVGSSAPVAIVTKSGATSVTVSENSNSCSANYSIVDNNSPGMTFNISACQSYVFIASPGTFQLGTTVGTIQATTGSGYSFTVTQLQVPVYKGVSLNSGGANLPAPASIGLCLISTGTTKGAYAWSACSGSASIAWAAITAGTNAGAGNLLVGAGSTVSFVSTGVVNANQINTGTVPLSAAVLGSNGSNQLTAAALTSGKVWVGSAGNLPVAQTISGDSSLTNAGVMTNTGLNGVTLSSLATGILKNTTGTGVPSIAVAGDFPTLNQNTTGNAGTATALASTPSLCSTGSAPTGILVSGNATGCAVFGTITGVTAGTGLTGGGSSGSVTLTVANPLPSLPQGTTVSNNGSANTTPYPPRANTAQWGSSNAGANGQAAFSALYTAGLVDFISEDNCGETSPDIVVNPFAATHVPLKPEYVICKTTTLEVPMTVAAGVTPATSTEGMATLRGAGRGWSGYNPQPGGTELKAGASFPKGGSVSGSQCTGCTVLPGQILEAYVDDGTNSALNSSNPCPAITWASSAPGSGAVCYVGNGSTTFLTSFPLGVYVSVPNGITATATNQVYSQIYSVIDNQHAIGFVQVACAPAGGITTTSNYSMLPAMVPLGVGGNATNCNAGGLYTNHRVNQGINLGDLSINVAAKIGAFGVVDYASPEGTNVSGRIYGFNGVGIDCETFSCQSAVFHDLMFTPDNGTNQTGLTTGFVCNGAAPQSLSHSLFANSSGSTDIGIIDNCANWTLESLHLEHADPAIAVSHDVTCTKDPCPEQIPATGTPTNQLMARIDMSSVGATGTNGILLDTTHGEPTNITILDASVSAGLTNVLNDVGKSNIILSSVGNVTAYFKDGSTFPFAIAPCNNFNNGICEYAGDMALYSSGGKLWDLGAAGRLTVAGNTINSNSSILVSGNPVPPGSTSAIAFPQLYFNMTGNTGPTTFNTGGTLAGGNAPSGFTGNLFDFYVNGGSSLFSVNYQGNGLLAGTLGVVGVTTFGTQNSTAGALTVNGSASAGGAITIKGDGLTPGSSTISANTAGTTLNLGSTNATVDTSGNAFFSGTLGATGHVTFEGVTSTGSTGSGALVFATSPALVTPALGTPASGVLTNATGYPLSSLAAAGGGNTISNGNNSQSWRWAITSNNKVGMLFTESAAATNGTQGNQAIVEASAVAGSTAIPLAVVDSLSGSQTLPTFYVAPTWNTTGVVAGGIYETVTNTASGIASSLLHLDLGGTQFVDAVTQSATVATAATDGPNIKLGGSLPQISTPGTTPYLNMNTLVKDTKNTCTFALTTSTFTLALSPVSLCTFTLPNAAVVWYWSCTLGWSNVAGTTPTFAEGVTWAQAPSAAFQMASIDTTNAGVGTQGTTATTTNANILATGTVTNSATIFLAQMSGTFTGSATSGVFSPTVSLTGSGATGTAVGGCTIQ